MMLSDSTGQSNILAAVVEDTGADTNNPGPCFAEGPSLGLIYDTISDISTCSIIYSLIITAFRDSNGRVSL